MCVKKWLLGYMSAAALRNACERQNTVTASQMIIYARTVISMNPTGHVIPLRTLGLHSQILLHPTHVLHVNRRIEHLTRAVVLEDEQPPHSTRRDQQPCATETGDIREFAVDPVGHIVHSKRLHSHETLLVFLWGELRSLAGVDFLVQDLCPAYKALVVELDCQSSGYCTALW